MDEFRDGHSSEFELIGTLALHKFVQYYAIKARLHKLHQGTKIRFSCETSNLSLKIYGNDIAVDPLEFYACIALLRGHYGHQQLAILLFLLNH